MNVLILGATGATGKLVVQKMLAGDIQVRAVVRDTAKLDSIKSPRLTIFQGTILDLSLNTIEEILTGCDVIVSCLGHNLTFRGMFGKPRLLVTDSIKRICEAASRKDNKYKLILMNTTANQNREIRENYPISARAVLGLLSLILPPQKDNVNAAKYLSECIGKNGNVEWIVVRPDTLKNEENDSEYSVYEEIQRDPVFNAGKVSRINVSDFMVRLVKDDLLWEEWKFKMPVLYNA